jgi:hypothetical protein
MLVTSGPYLEASKLIALKLKTDNRETSSLAEAQMGNIVKNSIVQIRYQTFW